MVGKKDDQASSLASLAPQLAASANSIIVAATTLSGSTGLFAAAFSTGASEIGQAGQTAASILQGAAPGIGASIGNAASRRSRRGIAICATTNRKYVAECS